MERTLAIETIKNLMASSNISFEDLGGQKREYHAVPYETLKSYFDCCISHIEECEDKEDFQSFIRDDMMLEPYEAKELGIEMPRRLKVLKVSGEITLYGTYEVAVPDDWSDWEINEYIRESFDLSGRIIEDPNEIGDVSIDVEDTIEEGYEDELSCNYDNDIDDF